MAPNIQQALKAKTQEVNPKREYRNPKLMKMNKLNNSNFRFRICFEIRDSELRHQQRERKLIEPRNRPKTKSASKGPLPC